MCQYCYLLIIFIFVRIWHTNFDTRRIKNGDFHHETGLLLRNDMFQVLAIPDLRYGAVESGYLCSGFPCCRRG